MQLWEKSEKVGLAICIITASCVVLGSILFALFGNAVIEAAYKGDSISFLNQAIAHHRMSRPHGTLEHYLTLGRLLFSRILFLCILAQLTLMAAVMHRHTTRILKEFFFAATHPLNLAVFRVVLFYIILNSVDIPTVVWFSQIPAELRVAPIGVQWLIDYLPINPTWATTASVLLIIASFTGMIGLFSRTSAILVVILGFFVLGIPQFYGKVNHYHHLLWFAAILAACRCGDALSCDAIVAAWKRADRGVTDPPSPSRIYALPLRLVWLLLGMIYFFAGFWKLWSAGVDWALSENLKFIMYQKWTELGGWTPFFRIDRYPILYQAGAMATILFEISFVFLIFSRKLRLLAPLGGLVFHTMTGLFMRISFNSLLRCYIAFFDWYAIFHRVGGWLYRDTAYVLYDGNCKLCRRTIASLRVFDIFGGVTYVNALDKQTIIDSGLGWLDSTALMQNMHVVIGKNHWAGFPAYRVWALRIPVLWPLVPFLYIWPIPSAANRIYRLVADSRVCHIADAAMLKPVNVEERRQSGCGATAVVGTFLVLSIALAGIGDVGNAWPLARYPTFEGISGPEMQTLEMVVVNQGRETIPLLRESLGYDLELTRFLGLISTVRIAKNESERRLRANALWKLWTQNNARHRGSEFLRVYEVTLSAIPERQSENPIQRALLLEVGAPSSEVQKVGIAPRS